MTLEIHKIIEVIIQKEIPILEQMDIILAAKEQEIIKGNLSGIIQLDQDLEETYSRMRELELRKIKELEQIQSSRVPLSDIIEQSHWPNKTSVLELIVTMKSIINGIKKKVNSNKILLEQSIKWIDHSVNSIIKAAMPQEITYTQNGKASEFNLDSLISVNQIV